MQELKLKEIDKKLLNLVQEEIMCVPHLTKIARKMRLPISTIKSKLDKFQKLGVIKGYSAILNPDKINKDLVAFWFAKVKKGPGASISSVPNKLKVMPQIQGVYFISGEWDILMKGRLKDHREYAEIAEQLASKFEEQSGMGIFVPKCFKDTHKILVD